MGTSTVQITHKALANCTPGELIRFPYGDTSITAIVLEQGPEETALGCLSGPEDKAHHWHWQPRSLTDRCITYGTQWVIEPVNGRVIFPKQGAPSAGSLLATRQGLALYFLSSMQGASIRVINTMEEVSGNFPSLDSWRLWLSNRDRFSAHAAPFLFRGSSAWPPGV